MGRAKQVADLITSARLLLGLGLVYLGWSRGAAGIEPAVWIMIVNWTGDCMDGPIARRSRPFYHTWVGDHDLEIDMAVAAGLLGYLTLSGFIDFRLTGAYLFVSGIVFWRVGIPPALGMLFQAPIYGWFIWVAIHQAPSSGWCLPAWILAAIVLTWPRLPREILPGFLAGMRQFLTGSKEERHSPRRAG